MRKELEHFEQQIANIDAQISQTTQDHNHDVLSTGTEFCDCW
jgi:hypothetical protein